MSDGQPADDKIESERIRGFSVSPDGKQVRMELATKEDGGKVYLTMPVSNVPEFHRALGDLMMGMRERGLLPPVGPSAQGAGSWMVGNSNNPDLKGFTALVFDQRKPNERTYMLGDVDALAIADAIERNIYKKLTPDEKIVMDRARRKVQAPKIIMPGTQH